MVPVIRYFPHVGAAAAEEEEEGDVPGRGFFEVAAASGIGGRLLPWFLGSS